MTAHHKQGVSACTCSEQERTTGLEYAMECAAFITSPRQPRNISSCVAACSLQKRITKEKIEAKEMSGWVTTHPCKDPWQGCNLYGRVPAKLRCLTSHFTRISTGLTLSNGCPHRLHPSSTSTGFRRFLAAASARGAGHNSQRHSPQLLLATHCMQNPKASCDFGTTDLLPRVASTAAATAEFSNARLFC